MADNNRNHGYRANTPYDRTQRATPSARPQGDPLAELARLIGQQNESAPSYRQNGAPASNYDQGHSNDGWSQPSQDLYAQYDGYSSRGYSNESSPSGYSDPQVDSRYVDPRYDTSHGYNDPSLAPGSYPSAYSDSRYSDPQQSDPRYADQRYADPHYDAPQEYNGPGYATPQGYADSQGYSDPRYAASSHDASSYDGQGYGAQQAAYPQDASGYGNMPSFVRPDGQAGYADPFYGNASPANMHMPMAEDHAPARRRGSIVTVLAVLALAVVGTAAAFGYRAMFGTAGTPVPPPVIKADPRPSKVVPVAGDPNAKPIQDRVGGDAERVVSREETPIDPSRGSSPRVIFPNLAEQGQKPSGPAVAANVGSTGSAPAAGPAEPKKIRTVAIKPDQGAIQGPAARNAQASADNAPLPLSPGAQQAPAAPHRQAPPPQQQASRGVPNGSPFPAPIGNAGNAAPAVAAGPYAVQVTSQRSEADAHASYKSLQAQFPSVLGSRQPVIKKADLGDKGTYYRAQIPFSSQNEASEFCSSLKAAGGQCVVQKN